MGHQSMIGKDEIHSRFGFHKATVEGENATLPQHTQLRVLICKFAEQLDVLLPDGREKSIAFTELETASMYAHKAVAKAAPLVKED